MITKKKLLIGAVVISSTVLLASCGKTTTAKELRIVDNCDTANDLCEFELTDAVVSRYTNVLGKTIERVESKTPLRDSDIKGTITWNTPAGASFADNTTVKSELGVSCQDDSCTANSNPTAYNLPVGSNTISVSGTVTVDGKEIDLATDVKPDVVDTAAVENSYTFQTGTLPDGLTISALVDALNTNKGHAHGAFSVAGQNFRITCDQGYEWLDDQNPAYGTRVDSDITRGVAQAGWDVNSASFYSIEPRDINFTANGARIIDPPNHYVWNMGCWPVESSR
ncbi:hypothetical protein B4919_04650 [Francisella tularensis subsp. novicida]|uniref:DUF3281 family protein n=1 Tax=Francisella tularensis TaxID=263 RepID=UPI000CE2925C|nr:DUF3281 family protein [Francisella tularensis]AVC45060.1 hypothetical protein B4919_04650 [Francisella tularensis subsp. novicida]